MPAPLLLRGLATVGVVALLALGGCGSDTSAGGEQTASAATPSDTADAASPAPSSSTEPDTAEWASCSEVWVADQTLPGRYPGCVDGDQAVPADRLGCSSGQRMIRFDDRYYAVPGGTIYRTDTALSDDRGYRAAVAICRG